MEIDTLGKEAQKILEIAGKLATATGIEAMQLINDLKQQCLVSGPRLAREYLVLKTQVKP